MLQFLFLFNYRMQKSGFSFLLFLSIIYFSQSLKYEDPILHAESQTIKMNDRILSYNLKFKIEVYNNEILLLIADGNEIVLYNCKEDNKELICSLEKNILLSIMETNFISFQLGYISSETQEKHLFDGIIIYAKYSQKKDIRINIIKLLVNCTETYRAIAYETDVYETPIISTSFTNKFNLEFENTNNEIVIGQCRLAKYEIGLLLVLCELKNAEGEYQLKEIENEIILDEINANYNFIIQPVKNKESFVISNGVKSIGYKVYNRELDFRKKDSFEILYYFQNSKGVKNIKLNNTAITELDCRDTGGNKIKNCIVKRNHFNGQKNGFYYASYENHCGKAAFLYEFEPAKVIFN